MNPESSSPPRILALPDGATIAYHRTPGKGPGVVFLTGYRSDMTGGKAVALETFCRARGQAFLRFDYTGHGASSGRFEDGTIGRWTGDALAAFDALSDGPQVVVGSSMGGWIMLLLALARPRRTVGLVGVAAAPDFTEDLIGRELSPAQQATLDKDGVVYVASPYDPEPTPFTKALIEDGKRHLLLRGPIPLACPVRLLHGLRDPDVPWQTALHVQRMLETDDVAVTLIKDGEHRLSRDRDIARLCRTVGGLLDEVERTP